MTTLDYTVDAQPGGIWKVLGLEHNIGGDPSEPHTGRFELTVTDWVGVDQEEVLIHIGRALRELPGRNFSDVKVVRPLTGTQFADVPNLSD